MLLKLYLAKMSVYLYFIFLIQIFFLVIFRYKANVFYLKIGESSYSAQLVVQMLFWNRWKQESAGVVHRPGVFTSTFLGKKNRSHASHAARSTSLVRTWMDQSETLLLFFAETNQRQSCSRVTQSSSSPVIMRRRVIHLPRAFRGRPAVSFPANSSHICCVELTLDRLHCTHLGRNIRSFGDAVFPFHKLDAFATLVDPNKGETDVCGCHCQRDMAVCTSEVMARPWVGVCVPLALSLHYFNCNRIKLKLFFINYCISLQFWTNSTERACR